MKRLMWLALGFAVNAGTAASAMAATEATSDGAVGIKLSKALYCSTKDLVQGNVGMLVGLLMLIGGFWILINGGKIAGALAMIIMGGLVTALPSIIESGFSGLSNLLKTTQISANTYSPPQDCSTAEDDTGHAIPPGGIDNSTLPVRTIDGSAGCLPDDTRIDCR